MPSEQITLHSPENTEKTATVRNCGDAPASCRRHYACNGKTIKEVAP